MKSFKIIWMLTTSAVFLGSMAWSQTAPTFTVNSTADVAVFSGALDNGICETAVGNGVCTLRAAIIKANHWPGGGVTIILPAQPPGVKYSLTIPPDTLDDETTGNLDITNSMDIIGGEAADTIIEGNILPSIFGGVFTIHRSTTTVNISGVTIRNGKSSQNSGGLANEGDITLSNCIISANSGVGGGGIVNIGIMSVRNSIISGNSAPFGGGIANISGGVIAVANSTISGNSSDIGGGIYNNALNSIFTIVNSTVSGNSANTDGGGIANFLGTINIFNGTISHNLADNDLNGSGIGGGIYNSGGVLNFKNSIIAGNRESAFFTSFFISVPGDCAGTLTSQGSNIVSTPNCTIIGSFIQADPLLGPLQYNGGPTQTHALLLGSPAIDTGETPQCTDDLGSPITTDQRGNHRPADGGQGLSCDIGAFELYRFGQFLPLIMR